MLHIRKLTLSMIAGLAAMLCASVMMPDQVVAQTRPLVYQGQLVDDAGVPIDLSDPRLGADAGVEVTLSRESGGAETSCGTTRELDGAGQFSVVLGPDCQALLASLGSGAGAYYSVYVGSGASRLPLVSSAPVGAVPFAQRAAVAETGTDGFTVAGNAVVNGQATVGGRVIAGSADSTSVFTGVTEFFNRWQEATATPGTGALAIRDDDHRMWMDGDEIDSSARLNLNMNTATGVVIRGPDSGGLNRGALNVRTTTGTTGGIWIDDNEINLDGVLFFQNESADPVQFGGDIVANSNSLGACVDTVIVAEDTWIICPNNMFLQGARRVSGSRFQGKCCEL